MVRRVVWGGVLLVTGYLSVPLPAYGAVPAGAELATTLPRAGGLPSELLIFALPFGVALIGLGLALRRAGSR